MSTVLRGRDHEMCFDGEKTRLNAEGAPAYVFFPRTGRHLAEGLINGRGSLWLERKAKARPFNEVIASFARNNREYTLGRSSKGRYYLRVALDDRYNLMSEIKCVLPRWSSTDTENERSTSDAVNDSVAGPDTEILAA